MRGIAVGVAVCVLLATVVAPGAASTADLVIQVDGLVKSFPGDAGVYVADPLAPQPLYTHDADVSFITASLYKLGILAQAESLVDVGKLKYTDTIEIQPEDVTADGSYEIAGTVMTIDVALEAMITVSDNGTALAFWHFFGPDNINATLQKLGLNAFHIANDDNSSTIGMPLTLYSAMIRRAAAIVAVGASVIGSTITPFSLRLTFSTSRA